MALAVLSSSLETKLLALLETRTLAKDRVKIVLNTLGIYPCVMPRYLPKGVLSKKRRKCVLLAGYFLNPRKIRGTGIFGNNLKNQLVGVGSAKIQGAFLPGLRIYAALRLEWSG